MTHTNGAAPRAPFTHRIGHRLIGLGLWLVTLPTLRPPLWHFAARQTGAGAVRIVNDGLERQELARRHAKPSSRKRIIG